MRHRGLTAPSLAHRAWWVGLIGVLLVACGGDAPKLPPPPASVAPASSPTAGAVGTTGAMGAIGTRRPTGARRVRQAPGGNTANPPSSRRVCRQTAPAALSAPRATPAGSAPSAGQRPRRRSPDRSPKSPTSRNCIVGDGSDGYGFNDRGLEANDAFRDKVYTGVQDAGFGWVRQQVSWAAMEPKKGNFGTDTTAFLDKFVDGAAAKNLKIMLSVVKSPDWRARTVACHRRGRTSRTT